MIDLCYVFINKINATGHHIDIINVIKRNLNWLLQSTIIYWCNQVINPISVGGIGANSKIHTINELRIFYSILY